MSGIACSSACGNQRAKAARRGIWNPTYCGPGPQDAARLQLTVNGDADGIDDENRNGEWVRIRNLDPVTTVHLGGWALQQSTPGRYVLLVDWDSVEAHTVGFRESAAFAEWRALIGPFFAKPPCVEHFHVAASS